MRLPFRYSAAFARGAERRQFTVYAWNKDEAFVAALRALEALGEDPKAWWFVGSERNK